MLGLLMMNKAKREFKARGREPAKRRSFLHFFRLEYFWFRYAQNAGAARLKRIC